MILALYRPSPNPLSQFSQWKTHSGQQLSLDEQHNQNGNKRALGRTEIRRNNEKRGKRELFYCYDYFSGCMSKFVLTFQILHDSAE